MLLNALERITLLRNLPREDDFETLKIVRKLKADLAFSEDECRDLDLKSIDNGTLQWNTAKDIPREIAIGEKETIVIVTTLRKLNDEKKLTNDHFSLYEKFIGD